MARWHGKSRGNRLGYGIFVFLCKTVGIQPAYFLLRFVAAYFFLFSVKPSRSMYRYFTDFHGYSPWKAMVSVYKNFYVFGQTLLDKVMVMANMSNPFTFAHDGGDNLQEIARQGRGGILISAHIGNWEIAGHLLKRLDTPVNIVMFDGEHQQIKSYLDQVTGKKNFKVIVIKNDLSHVYAIGDALNNNELICLHGDRFIEGNKTVIRPFLGVPARFPHGPFVLASTFKVPVSLVYSFKETDSHYHFYSSPLMVYDGSTDRGQWVDQLIDTFVGSMEGMVRKYPLQWFNYYNFWENKQEDAVRRN